MEIMSAYLMGNGHPNAPANTFESKRYAAALMDMETKLLGDMFGIDDLLDFSNEEIGAPIGKEAFPAQQQGIIGNNFQAIDTIGESIISSNLDNADQQTEIQAQAQTAQNQVLDFAVHCEELAELEWLSNFVEDSSSIADAKPEGAYNVALVKDHTKESNDQTGFSASTGGSLIIDQYSNLSSASSPLILEIENDEDPALELPNFPVPSRARSNRPRKPTKSWAIDILSAPAIAESGITTTTDTISDYTDTLLIESPNHQLQFITPESSSDSGFVSSPDLNTETFSCAENPQLISSASPVSTLNQNNSAWNPSYKPYSPSSSSGTSGTSNGNGSGKKRQLDPAHVQRCLHCATQRTPQWRAGPWGPKTLCNACGVRYKSGRLFPEYRPAASPTFVPHIHSNSHRKVLEMRRNTELVSSSSSLFLQWQ